MTTLQYLRALEAGNPAAFAMLTMFFVIALCAIFTDKSDRRGY